MPAAKQHALPRFLYLGLAILFAISITYRVRDTVDRTDQLLHGHDIAQFPFDPDRPNPSITDLKPEAVAAGLTPQDTILAVNGRPVRSAPDLFVPFRNTPAGQPISLDVQSSRRDVPGRRTVTITLEPMRQRVTPSANVGC